MSCSLEKIEQRKLKVGCNFTDYMSEIALGVVKFLRFFNFKLLIYFLQLNLPPTETSHIWLILKLR